MENLNSDVCINIFKHLDVDHLINMSKQNKYMKQTVNDYLRDLKIDYIEHLHVLKSLKKYKEKYNMLKEALKYSTDNMIIDKCPNC